MLSFPSNFDPNKKYPLLVSVYAGPATNGARETFMTPNPLDGIRLSHRVLRLAERGRPRQEDPSTRSTCISGVVEMDDQAAGVKSLWDRPYVGQEPGRDLRHVLWRICVGDVPAPSSGRFRGGLRLSPP